MFPVKYELGFYIPEDGILPRFLLGLLLNRSNEGDMLFRNVVLRLKATITEKS
jgi:hypothetical protein